MSKERTRNGQPRQSEGVRAFKRGLDVLQEVNRSGGIRAGDVARALDLPRPTVYRLLETLEELGYIARSASDDRFRVTRRALSLGDGYDPGVVICQAAAPYLADLSKKLVWPVDLSTYENAAMVVQETTHSRSPLSIDRGMIGKRLPMLRTSAGRAYLAACPARERDLIINHLRRIDEVDDRPFLDQGRLDRMIAETAARGYAIRSEGEYNPKTASIAVAIVRDGAVFGCISIIWIRSALGIDEAVAQFANQLLDTASAIPVAG
ncbi:DNA-binding transcriptional regulator [Bradyrhizobium sp. DASA03005]|uniref:DNA-binding transcriptional regulator n=1 Tax=Bradyrhizobium TaxID=374 RepID=UPI00155E046C|nr:MULTISPECIES: DNA-binding transcriptional regulator [Bradyrhizobium]MBR1166783.1 DNA-binding transcriptional regulator [Bradyrhizobium liaoningense]MDD1516584.1 transcriptional regulator [Bradyrhizobium sp. WBAH30]MDD1542790.1 transcriptional regulator [Bradyrhizobium sp. WBAH41]MDD1554487.1 transcriptional regulator [Bradyrhizobium sp. WBAH23]MDD1562438.1 transcriptional regulator [Bradyrhizobium sp. WBAH33]